MEILTQLVGLVDLLVGLDEGEVGEGVQSDGGGVAEGEATCTNQLQGEGVRWDAGGHLYVQLAGPTWETHNGKNYLGLEFQHPTNQQGAMYLYVQLAGFTWETHNRKNYLGLEFQHPTNHIGCHVPLCPVGRTRLSITQWEELLNSWISTSHQPHSAMYLYVSSGFSTEGILKQLSFAGQTAHVIGAS